MSIHTLIYALQILVASILSIGALLAAVVLYHVSTRDKRRRP
jgi:hypothetical protein